MGFVPVFFALEGPRELDSDGIVLAAFGQIVADDHKRKADEEGQVKRKIDFITESHQQRDEHEAAAERRYEPKHHPLQNH